ncbi:MAG TPA: TonB-dependent receptor plug domain-containing protein, partial [Puia sp.]
MSAFGKNARTGLTGFKNTGRHLKIISSLLLAACLQLPANAYSQGISLSVKNASLDTVFARIQKQSPYRFIFTSEELQGTAKLSFTITEAGIREILHLCFKDQPLTYSMEDIYIIVKRKEKKENKQEEKGAEINVGGKVINEDGEGLAAVTVMNEDQTLGTASNEQGFFELKGVPADAVLLISSMGYEQQRLPLNGRTNLLLQLKTAANNLDELIVKGYYSTSRRLNTGSVTRVSSEQIATQPVSNPVLALQGLVPGLLITQDNGLPGSRFTTLIRGQNSIQSGNSPLYIIDGVPFLSDNESLTQLNGILANSPFNSIDPADIESIEVLKDADATSIYGSRGANGVILITTRKAKTGKSALSLNAYQ